MHYKQSVAAKLVISVPVSDLPEDEIEAWMDEAIHSSELSGLLISGKISFEEFLEGIEPSCINLGSNVDEYVDAIVH